jgi:hypothetical protein
MKLTTSTRMVPVLDPKPVVKGPINGNAFAVMAAVNKALRRAGASEELMEQYKREATSGSYDNLLAVSMDYVDFNL